jgi:hypothetical protein
MEGSVALTEATQALRLTYPGRQAWRAVLTVAVRLLMACSDVPRALAFRRTMRPPFERVVLGLWRLSPKVWR